MKTEAQLLSEKQVAYEQQQRLFEEHIQHFVLLDSSLQQFADARSFAFEKNALHSPCRFLRRNGNPSHIISIQQEGVWHKVSYRDNLPHSFSVSGYWQDERKEFVYQISKELAYFVLFSALQENLQQLLAEAAECVEYWTAEVIRAEGARSNHPMAYWHDQGGIKIQTIE